MFNFLLIITIILSFLCGVGFLYWKVDRGIKRFIIAFLIVLFSFIIAFRPNEVPDTLEYNKIFDSILVWHNYGFDIFGECLTVEYGFLYLMMFFKGICDNACFFYFFLTLITCFIFTYAVSGLFYYFVKMHINIPLLLCVFFSYYGIYYSGIAIRQGLAFALCFLAAYYFVRRKYIPSLFSLFAAFLIHRLSILTIVCLIFYALFRRKNLSVRFLATVNCLCLVYYLANVMLGFGGFIYDIADRILYLLGLHNAFGNWITHYANMPNHLSFTNLFICLQGFILILLSRNCRGMRLFCGIYLIGEIISVLFSNMAGASRLYDFFTIYSVCIIAFALMQALMKDNPYQAEIQNNSVAKSRNLVLLATGVLLLCNIVLVLNIIGF